MNIFDRKQEPFKVDKKTVLHQSEILPGSIPQRAIKEGLIVFRGLVADRPTTGSEEKQVFFATDENKLYIWNDVSEAWVSVTLA